MQSHLPFSTRSTLQKAIAGFVALGVAILGMLFFGGDEDKDRRVVESLCDHGLDELAVRGGLDLCTHGPDPKRAFAEPVADRIDLTPVRPSALCRNSGGQRIHIYLGTPANKSSTTTRAQALRAMGLAEAALRHSHPTFTQGYRWLCSGSAPVTTPVALPAITNANGADYWDALFAPQFMETLPPNEIAVVFFGDRAEYPYCGQGSTMNDDRSASTNTGQLEQQVAMISCDGDGEALAHEIGHNLGAVQPAAPESSGDGWHCHVFNDLMCYDDDGSFFQQGGHMTARCTNVDSWFVDCGKDSYWDPKPAAARAGYLSSHWDTADSPYLTRPRRK